MRVKIDEERFEVFVDGKRHELSDIPFRILSLLAKADGKLISRAELLRKIWGFNDRVQKRLRTKIVEQQISRLRKAISPRRRLIRTVQNRGYGIVR